MKYKAGDKVIIKTWAEMIDDGGESGRLATATGPRAKLIKLSSGVGFVYDMEMIAEQYFDRIVTVESENGLYYTLEEGNWCWYDSMIKGLALDRKICYNGAKRFNLIDIRDD